VRGAKLKLYNKWKGVERENAHEGKRSYRREKGGSTGRSGKEKEIAREDGKELSLSKRDVLETSPIVLGGGENRNGQRRIEGGIEKGCIFGR